MLPGSMASNYWGIPRTTHDLDFVLSSLGEAGAGRAVPAIASGGFLVSLRSGVTDGPVLLIAFQCSFGLVADFVEIQ